MLGYDKLTSNMLAYTALRTKLPPEIRRLNKCFSSVIPATFYCCILPAVKLLHIVKIQMPVSFLTRSSQGLRSNELELVCRPSSVELRVGGGPSPWIATCLPPCNVEHHGYDLLATIDGTDSTFSCKLFFHIDPDSLGYLG